MRLVFVHSSRPESVKYMRHTLDRIVAFCESLDSDADPEQVYAEAAANYFVPDPSMIMFAGVDDDDKVVAHLMATMDDYFGGKFVTIHQCWKNSDVEFELGGKQGLVEVLKDWGKTNGATDVRTFCRNETVAQILLGYDCGFERSEKVILSASIV